MKLNINKFRVPEGKKVSLVRVPTLARRYYRSKKQYEAQMEEQRQELRLLQEAHYANDRYSVLFIFQAMDAAGKDGAIKHVMSGVNPQGCQVFSFKHPSATELDHDFMWRVNQCLPERGRIGIFNRSYYEEVLVVRVHPRILQGQALPEELTESKSVWKGRYQSMRDFEAHLHRNGTRVVKFFLHLSYEEQRARFLERIDDPEKNWKMKASDVAEREHWDAYMSAYEECLSATSTADSPWYIVPADDKRNARLIISNVVLATLRSLKLSLPPVTTERAAELAELRAKLTGRTKK